MKIFKQFECVILFYFILFTFCIFRTSHCYAEISKPQKKKKRFCFLLFSFCFHERITTKQTRRCKFSFQNARMEREREKRTLHFSFPRNIKERVSFLGRKSRTSRKCVRKLRARLIKTAKQKFNKNE